LFEKQTRWRSQIVDVTFIYRLIFHSPIVSV